MKDELPYFIKSMSLIMNMILSTTRKIAAN